MPNKLTMIWKGGPRGMASIQKLSRPERLTRIAQEHFDDGIVDEVLHARVPSYRRFPARIQGDFMLGLGAGLRGMISRGGPLSVNGARSGGFVVFGRADHRTGLGPLGGAVSCGYMTGRTSFLDHGIGRYNIADIREFPNDDRFGLLRSV